MKIMFLTTIPSPYRVNFFNELGKKCDLTVIFEKEASTERDNEWNNYKVENFKAVFLKGYAVKVNKAFCPEIIKIYKKTPNDILVIGGYNTPTAMYLITYLKRHKIKFILNADGGVIKQESKLVYLIKKYFISSAFMWIGTSDGTKEYFRHYGADIDKIKMYPFTSIYDRYVLNEPVTESQKKMLRKKLNMKDQYTIISVGQFIHRKGFDILLKALGKINKDIQAYIIGGKETNEYMSIVKEYDLENVHFLSFMDSGFLREYYMASDLFVLATREDIWGLVINEAASCALPIVTTNACVAGVEFINKFNNGVLINKEDINGLAYAICSIKDNESMQNRMKKNSLAAARNYTFEKMVDVHIDIFNDFINKQKEDMYEV